MPDTRSKPSQTPQAPGSNDYQSATDNLSTDAVHVIIPPEPPAFGQAAAHALVRLLLAADRAAARQVDPEEITDDDQR